MTLVATALTGCYTGPDGRLSDSDTEGMSVGDSTPTGGDSSESGPDSDSGGDVDVEHEPAPAALRLLLARQYRNSLRDLLGPSDDQKRMVAELGQLVRDFHGDGAFDPDGHAETVGTATSATAAAAAQGVCQARRFDRGGQTRDASP